MNFSLLHAGLAAGAALAAIPVILHLFMRQTPKHVIFPALRLIRERHKRSKKQLKVKNWLLLAARMLLFMLMALALARPSLTSEGTLGDGEVPSARAFVFDTSMSMEYTEKGNDRLTEAKLRANEILKKSTDDSEIFVIDSAEPRKGQALSPVSARKMIDALTLRAANRTLNDAVILASQAVSESALPRREVYVLTDLAGSAWELGSTRTIEALGKVRQEKKGVKTFVLKLTPKEVKDVAVIAAEPTSTIVAEGEPVEIRATLRSAGPACERVVELQLDGNKRGEKVVKIPANGEVEVLFAAPSTLVQGLHQGMIKLGTGPGDFMEFDDRRYFSFKVQPTMKVLIVADVVTADDLEAFFVRSALAPSPSIGAPEAIASPYKIERETRKQFQDRSRLSIKDFAAIFVLNLDGLTSNDWRRLSEFVGEGGGLVLAPGNRVSASTYGTNASSVLPATLDEKKELASSTTFGKMEEDHPLFNRHPKLLAPEFALFPIFRYWSVKPIENVNARTLLRYADGSPALIERAIKGPRTGHVLLWTTPLSRRVNTSDVAAWNDFPNSWSFVDIMNQIVPYLAGTAGEQLNYEAGQDALLTIDPNSKASTYTVQGPDPKVTDRLSAPTASNILPVPSPQKAGQWRVDGKGPNGSESRLGFSVNVSPMESQVIALKPNDLDPLLGGKDDYQLANNEAELERAQNKIRIGYDLFPWLMLLILALVTAENLLANKFHRNVAKA